jgi:hypothetical protein
MPALPTSRVKMSIEAQVCGCAGTCPAWFPRLSSARRLSPWHAIKVTESSTHKQHSPSAVIACMPQGLASKDWTSKSDPIGVIFAVGDTGAETVSAAGEPQRCRSRGVAASRALPLGGASRSFD